MRSIIAVAVFSIAAHAQPSAPTPLPEAAQSSVGFRSVGEALNALKAKPGVEFIERDGWTLAQDRESEKSMALWSFAPLSHAAYPSVVKRRVYEADGSVRIEMNVLCEATKEACDRLVREFRELTEQMQRRFNDAR
jgi:hypothetical protein